MKKKLINIVAALVAVVGISLGGAQSASAHMVGHITCATDWACVKSYYAADGYWMARMYYSNTWVRLTMVPGADNSHVAPITCASQYSCVLSYYKPYQQTAYYMARQANGTTWVRLTEQ
jgi:hypothetical protein